MAWTREQILAVKDLPLRQVTVEAWGPDATIWLRTMSAGERDRFFLLSRKSPDSLEPDPENFRARLLVYCICDDQGRRLFADDEIALLGEKCGEAINFLYAEAQALNAFSKPEPEQVEDARKNF
jgi:hypothetical protein